MSISAASTVVERRLRSFVDRRSELDEFCRMVDTGDRPILAISGDTGIGKSSLLERCVHECALRHVRKVEIDFGSIRYNTYLAIMRKVRDELGVEHFVPLTDLINYFTKPSYHLQVDVSAGSSIHVSQNVGTVEAGAQVNVAGVVIHDLMIVEPRTDLSVSEEERVARLTDRFLTDLERLLATTPVVFFFDHVDKATGDTRRWLWNELLTPLADGRLAGARFVLCVREAPKFEEELAQMRGLVAPARLQPLGLPDITEYLARREELRIGDAERERVAEMLLAASKGIPVTVATFVESFLQIRRRGD